VSPNSPPIAVDDSITVLEDQKVTIAPLANDTDADNDPLVITEAIADFGVVTINLDGTLNYLADDDTFDLVPSGKSATATINYSISDGNSGTASARVVITVNEAGDSAKINGTNKPDNLVGDKISDGAEDVIRGGNGNDVIKGLDGADTLYGENGNDHLYGGESIDKLFGGNGNDLLDGGDGNDFLYGELGDDTLTGGLGKDQFWFGKSGGTDTITDFTVGEDLICVSGIKNATSFASVGITQVGANTVLDMGGTHAILSGIQSSVLTADDFLFA
jgi:VCBS repeat-containing protein